MNWHRIAAVVFGVGLVLVATGATTNRFDVIKVTGGIITTNNANTNKFARGDGTWQTITEGASGAITNNQTGVTLGFTQATGPDATLTNEFATYGQTIQLLSAAGTHLYAWGNHTTNIAGIAPGAQFLAYTTPSPSNTVTTTVSSITNNQYVGAAISTNTFTSLPGGAVSFDVWLAKGGLPSAAVSLAAEFYIWDGATETELGASAAKVISSTKAEYLFSVNVPQTNFASAHYVVGKLKASGVTGSPSVSIYTDGNEDSHFQLPEGSLSLSDSYLVVTNTPSAGQIAYFGGTDGKVYADDAPTNCCELAGDAYAAATNAQSTADGATNDIATLAGVTNTYGTITYSPSTNGVTPTTDWWFDTYQGIMLVKNGLGVYQSTGPIDWRPYLPTNADEKAVCDMMLNGLSANWSAWFTNVHTSIALSATNGLLTTTCRDITANRRWGIIQSVPSHLLTTGSTWRAYTVVDGQQFGNATGPDLQIIAGVASDSGTIAGGAWRVNSNPSLYVDVGLSNLVSLSGITAANNQRAPIALQLCFDGTNRFVVWSGTVRQDGAVNWLYRGVSATVAGGIPTVIGLAANKPAGNSVSATFRQFVLRSGVYSSDPADLTLR